MRGDFAFMKDKSSSKLAGWKVRTLSQIGKTVLIQSNLACIPLFMATEVDTTNKDFF